MAHQAGNKGKGIVSDVATAPSLDVWNMMLGVAARLGMLDDPVPSEMAERDTDE